MRMAKAKPVGLSAEDICVIIEACAKSRVSSLAYAGLSIQFDVASARAWENALAPGFVDQPEGGETPSGGSQGASVQSFPMSAEDKAILEESRLAQLMTDNPLAYEQEMIDAQISPRVMHDGGEDS